MSNIYMLKVQKSCVIYRGWCKFASFPQLKLDQINIFRMDTKWITLLYIATIRNITYAVPITFSFKIWKFLLDCWRSWKFNRKSINHWEPKNSKRFPNSYQYVGRGRRNLISPFPLIFTYVIELSFLVSKSTNLSPNSRLFRF